MLLLLGPSIVALLMGAAGSPGAARAGALRMRADTQKGIVVGGHSHSDMHHIEVPLRAAAAAPKVEVVETNPWRSPPVMKPVIGGFSHTSLHHVEVDATTTPAARKVAMRLPAEENNTQRGIVVGGHSHTDMHHIEVPVQSAQPEVEVAEVAATTTRAPSERGTPVMKPVIGGFSHTSLHHIEVP